MSVFQLQHLAEKFGVDIPFDAIDLYSISSSFLDGLTEEQQKIILNEYGDAGRKPTYIFISKKKAPPIQDIINKTKELIKIEPESKFLEYSIYFDEMQIDPSNTSLRIRFHYLGRTIYTLDESGRQREQRLQHSGVAIYRANSRLLEVRVKHKSIAKKFSLNFPTYLGLEPYYSLNFVSEKLIKPFVSWISSLNSAMIELAISEVAGSLRITARKGVDLRTAAKFHQELKSGRLKGGHVTIQHNKSKINFRMHFRDCHIKYTLFTSEEEIKYILDAVEKIAEGYEFAKPDKTLKEFFRKTD